MQRTLSGSKFEHEDSRLPRNQPTASRIITSGVAGTLYNLPIGRGNVRLHPHVLRDGSFDAAVLQFNYLCRYDKYAAMGVLEGTYPSLREDTYGENACMYNYL